MAGFRCEEARASPLAGVESTGNGDGALGANSRPHSSTSAELENGMNTLTLQPQTAQQQALARNKETR